MKKFLSLVLAMIMTMSLVTISAGATEYKDLTDKDEIKYEEAVAVLNKIGVITGYSDGSFQPETELTRGAAAKIIVSLMIGPDAASALPNTSSPYPDVPAGHTFAGVISYCKTKGYISGYGDGNFKPAGTLTGYAFAKMLLGALGYSSDIERFTGSGWTMNVANVGNVAGLFDRISFDGAAAVTRDEACQLALNTLKATLVTYGGTSLINGTTGSYTIQGTQATPRTSNNRDINANIGRKDWYGGNNKGSDYLTLEFGEEHFKDLRLEHDRYDPAHDDFGRPSNEWSYKKVTIGTFPLEADYTFTTQVAHVEDTDGTKEKALGLRNFDLVSDGGYSTWNGWGNDGRGGSTYGGTTTLWQNGREDADTFAAKDAKVADIADYTDNGTLVEVYVSYVDADWITDVVVIQTQLMKVKNIGSDYVSLEHYDDPDQRASTYAHPTSTNGVANIGFNLSPIHESIEQVKDSNEDCYNILKDLKSGDKVAVVPVTTDDGKTYEAAEVYVPETVSGVLTRVDTYGVGTDANKDRGAVEITVGGTSYKIANWNFDMWDLKAEDIKATRKDVTLHMDEYGNAMLITDVGATNSFMVISDFYQALVGNKVCTFVHGWDIGGTEVDLNLGSSLKSVNHNGVQAVYGHVLGELVHYTSTGATGDADYVLTHHSNDVKGDHYTKAVWDVFTNLKKDDDTLVADGATDAYEIKASNLMVPLASKTNDGTAQRDGTYSDQNTTGLATHTGYTKDTYEHFYYDKGVKFIYVTFADGEVDSVEFKSGIQNVSNDELREQIMGWPSQAAVKDEQVKAVVIKRESADASLKNMLYVTKVTGYKEVDKDTNETFFQVEVVRFDDNSKLVEDTIMVNKDLQIGQFASYTKVAGTKYEDNFYRVKVFERHNANPAAIKVLANSGTTSTVSEVKESSARGQVIKSLINLNATSVTTFTGTKLVAEDSGSGATTASTDAKSYIMGTYRGSSTTVPGSVTDVSGIIRTDKAEWLNLTNITKYDDIDNAEDLFDIAGNGSSANVSLDILLNEKPDSDGFRTAYLIVIKAVGDEGKAPSGEWYSNVNTSSALKGVSIDISIDAAKYAAAGATATVNVTPVIDGVEGTPAQVTLKRSGDKMVGSARFHQGLDLSNAKISFTKDAEVYSAVKVRYFNGDGAEPVEITIKGATETLSSGVAGNVNFTWKTTDAGNSHELTGEIKGVNGAPVTYTTTDSASADRVFTKSVTPTGTDYVDVTITGIAALVENYTITIPAAVSGTGVAITDETAKATIDVNKNSGLKSGDPVFFKVALDQALDAVGVASYDVTFKLKDTDGNVVATLTAKGVKDTTVVNVDWTVTGSVAIVATDVSVKANASTTRPTGAENVKANTITLAFAGDVTDVDAADVVHVATDGTETPAERVVPEGTNKLNVWFPNTVTMAAGDVIVVKTDAVHEIPVTFAARTIAIADGDRVFVFQITETSGVKGAEVKDSMLYSAAKALAGASIPDEPSAGETDAEKVAAAKSAIAALNLAFDKTAGEASTTDAIKAAVKTDIISAASAKGVTVTDANITVTLTKDAVDGADGTPDGTAGSASAEVALTLNEATDTATVTITINAPAYQAPSA